MLMKLNYSPASNTEAILYVQISKLLHQAGRLHAIPVQKLMDSENITALYVISEISDLSDSWIRENHAIKAKSILLKYESVLVLHHELLRHCDL